MLVLVSPTAEVLARWPEPPLTASERDRAARMHDPADFIAAHTLAREAVGGLLGVPAGSVIISQQCEECGQPHGRPSVDGCELSWSHTEGVVAAVAAHTQVGIDLERRGQQIEDRLISRFCTPAEAARIRSADYPADAYLEVWCQKEALVKVGRLSLDQFGSRPAAAEGFSLQLLDYPGLVVAVAISS